MLHITKSFGVNISHNHHHIHNSEIIGPKMSILLFWVNVCLSLPDLYISCNLLTYSSIVLYRLFQVLTV